MSNKTIREVVMGRDIKFRAWDKKFKLMYRWEDLESLDLAEGTFINSSNSVIEGCEENIDDYLELMRFTGLTDKNGKEIYEGDIVENNPNVRWEVKWSDKKAQWRVWGGSDFALCSMGKVEVIGNIYENPELLKEEKSLSKPVSTVNTLDKILKAIDVARLGIADKTPDTPVSFKRFGVWEQIHTVALVQQIQALITEARADERQAMLDATLEGEISERNRWITPIQQKVLNEINACLSPRITDLINNTHLGSSTVQKALKKLIEVGLVRKIDNIYSIKNSSDMFECEYGCKNAGSHYHKQEPTTAIKLIGGSDESK